MGAKSERPKNRRVRLVGGGYKWTRGGSGTSSGSSSKSARRALRRQIKDRDLTPSKRRALKDTLRDMLLAKNRRGG